MSTPTFKTVSLSNEGFTGTYKLSRLNVFKQAASIRVIATTVAPALAGVKFAMGQELAKTNVSFDMGKAVEAVTSALGAMDEKAMESLFLTLFASTAAIGAQGEELPLDSSVSVSVLCNYDLNIMVRLALEVAEFNRFPFIEVVKSLYGNATKLTDGLVARIAKGEKTSTTSETSEPSETI